MIDNIIEVKPKRMSLDEQNALIKKVKKSGKIKEIDFKLNIGTKIKCVEPYGLLVEGDKYTIKDIIINKYFEGISLIELKEIPDKNFRADCFSNMNK